MFNAFVCHERTVSEHHTGEVGRQYAKKSQAKYQFKGQPNISALKTALLVYDTAKDNPKMKLWEIGKMLPAELDQLIGR